jgi:spermidine/putrescine transport system permease protein
MSNRHKRTGDRFLLLESAFVYLFLYAPILVLIVLSFNQSRFSAAWDGFTWDWYVRALQDEHVLEALKNSLVVAVLSTIISIIVGTLAALAVQRFQFRFRGGVQALVYLPIIIPEIVVAAALVTFFGFVEITLSLTTVIIAHVGFSISYVIIVVGSRLRGFDRTLEEAAMDLGANEIVTFFRVTLPFLRPAIVSGALLVFTLSIDDYVITSFVAGVGATTLPLQIYSMVKTGVTPEINAISSLLLMVTIFLIVLSQRLQTSSASK